MKRVSGGVTPGRALDVPVMGGQLLLAVAGVLGVLDHDAPVLRDLEATHSAHQLRAATKTRNEDPSG